MNNYKEVRNISTGTLVIHNIAQDPDGYGAKTLVLAPNELFDLSAYYPVEETAVCIGLEQAYTAGNLSVVSRVDGIAALNVALAALTVRVAALEGAS